MTATEASECAAQQDKFWEYHNLLYDNQRTGFTQENLVSLAGEVGLDIESFEQCLTDFPDPTALQNDLRLGQVMGVRGTPAFLVNGTPLAGAYPFEAFEQIIESLLKENVSDEISEESAPTEVQPAEESSIMIEPESGAETSQVF